MAYVNLPDHLRVTETLDEAAREAASIVAAEKRAAVLVVTGSGSTRKAGQRVVDAAANVGARVHWLTVGSNDYEEVQRATEQLLAGDIQVVIGVGGGRTLDVAKMAAHQANRKYLSIPTQLSHDGIASPVAVIRVAGRRRSLGTMPPNAVIIPLAEVQRAPRATVLAGLGDLHSNLVAVKDWELAHRHGRLDVPFNDYACLVARLAARTVLPDGELDLTDPQFLRPLAEGLVLSGISMAIAGSSRPASGAEHLISHALDELCGGIALHGVQVAIGTLVALTAYGQEEQAQILALNYARLGMFSHLEQPLEPELLHKAIHTAPLTRPDRYTVLNTVDLDELADACHWILFVVNQERSVTPPPPAASTTVRSVSKASQGASRLSSLQELLTDLPQ